MAAIAEDWNEELKEYPAWAIQSACRWWMSEGNPDRRKKPLPGDIAKRAKFEMGAVKLAKFCVSRFNAGTAQVFDAEPRQEPSDEEKARMAEYVAKAGFKPKGFGAEA